MEELEFSQLSDVLFPEMRRNVISAVRALSDGAYQKRVWIDQKYPQEGYYDDFAMNLHILFDDSLVLEDPVSMLGKVLKSQDEAAEMVGLASVINRLLEHEGDDRTDAEYMASPLWGAVVRSASAAYKVMTQ